MDFTLGFGPGTIGCSLPEENLLGILDSQPISALTDVPAAVGQALDQPIASPSFSRLFRPADKVTIVVSDITRVTGAEEFLPVLLSRISAAGVGDKNIKIIFATGTHWLHTSEQMATVLGGDIARRFTLIDHDCRKKEDLVQVGTTSRGTPVEISRHVTEADKVILTGSITYHYFAGFSGGRKALLPGVASFEAIQSNHKLCMSGPDGTRHPRSATAVLAGNPVHEDMTEAAEMLRPTFLLNTVINAEKRIGGIFAGEFKAAFAAGAEFLDRHYRVPIKEKADLVIVSAGGFPHDTNFVQAHKAMDHAQYALKQGGVMIFLAEAPQGFPSDKYEPYFHLGSPENIAGELKRNFTIPGQTVYSAFSKARKFRIIWVSPFMKRYADLMGVTSVNDISSALDLARQWLPGKFSAYVIPHGYTTFPVL